MKIWIVEGEHFNVPGRPIKAFLKRSDAILEAVELTNIMLKDKGWKLATAATWRRRMKALQDAVTQDCYVEILELEAQS